MGSILGKGDWKSDHDFRSRHQPDQWCKSDPSGIPGTDRERRKEIAKDIKKKGESAKVAVRNIRRDANDAFKKLSKSADISEDEIKELEDGVQKLTDKYIAQIDKAVDEKNKEILTV